MNTKDDTKPAPKQEAHKPMGAPDRDAAIHALIEAMQHLNNDNRGGQAQAEIDRAKAAMAIQAVADQLKANTDALAAAVAANTPAA